MLKSGFPLKPGTLLNKTKPELKSKGYPFVYSINCDWKLDATL